MQQSGHDKLEFMLTGFLQCEVRAWMVFVRFGTLVCKSPVRTLLTGPACQKLGPATPLLPRYEP